MSKLTDVRLFNHAAFKAQSTPRREKVLMAMQEPDKLKLSPDDEAYMEILIQAATIATKYRHSSMTKQATMLSKICGVSVRNCFNYLNDATYVFGNFVEVNRLWLKNNSRERINKIIKKLEDTPKPDYKLILEAEKLLILLDDLPRALPQGESEELQDLTIPVIEFTSNFEEVQIVHDEEE